MVQGSLYLQNQFIDQTAMNHAQMFQQTVMNHSEILRQNEMNHADARRQSDANHTETFRLYTAALNSFSDVMRDVLNRSNNAN